MNLRKCNNENLHVLRQWFKDHEWTCFDIEQLPEESWFVYINDVPVAFSCFLKTDTVLAIMGFTIATTVKIEGKSEALDTLLTHIQNRAKLLGFKYLHYYTDHIGMVNRMNKLGMKTTDNGSAYILLKSLGGHNTAFYDE